MQEPTIEDLRKIIAFSELPDEHLQWLLERCDYEEFDDGTPLIKTGEPIDFMWIMLEGRVAFYKDVNGVLVHYFNFENEPTSGGVGGLLPYSRLKTSPGSSFAVGHVRAMNLNKKHFHDLEQLNPDLIQRLISIMTERARYFATVQLQHEKVSALGKLSAGIAHELNNPAAAINRISFELRQRLKQNYDLTKRLLFHNISSDHIVFLRNLVDAREKDFRLQKKMTASQRVEKEDEISDWLNDNCFSINPQSTETFTDAGFLIQDFDDIRTHVGTEAFVHVLEWLENLLSSEKVIVDLEDASRRISELVVAIKSHVHMDRTNDMQKTLVHTDFDNTLILLGYKVREKNIKVVKEYAENLPEADAFIGELNQVWTNLIDNAIFALPKSGELTISTSFDARNVIVRITDNGTGIPPEIMSRIFDPFFTTKKVGEGTGIGLDLVNRIVKRHDGEIKVHSVPGKTQFTVCIPIVQTKSTTS